MNAFAKWRRLVVLPALLAVLLGAHAAPASFSVTDLNGKTHTLAGHQGKWVLVNLWATWCVPCLREMPELEALSKAHDDVVVLGLAVDGQSPRRVAQFAEKLHVSYPVVAGDEKLAAQFGARGYPTSILFDPAGKQVMVQEGPVTRVQIEGLLKR
jgi:thiol-disulfide isomerase/thioredoxin